MRYSEEATEVDLYLRISKDATGLGAGVTRQEAECLDLCERMRWTVRNVWTDNDVSATRSKRRPAFESMIEAQPGRIVMWSVDRLVRKGPDLERLIELNVPVHSVKAGPMDLSTASGRLNARLLTSVATFEGEIKAERQRAAAAQRAREGKSWWSSRPFGYDMDGTLRRPESDHLATMYADVLAGVPLGRIAKRLNAEGVTTAKGGQWYPVTVRQVLTNARNAAIKVYDGEEVGPGAWDAAVPEQTYRAAVRVLTDPRRTNNPPGKRLSMLTGPAVCGVCGGRIHRGYRNGRPRGTRSAPMYFCSTNRHVSVDLATLDEFVSGAVVGLLESRAADILAPVSQDADVSALRTEEAELLGRLDALAEDNAEGLITRAQLLAGTARIRARLAEIQSTLASIGQAEALAGLVGVEDVSARWEALDTDRRRAVVEALFDGVVITRGRRGARTFDPNRIMLVRPGEIV